MMMDEDSKIDQAAAFLLFVSPVASNEYSWGYPRIGFEAAKKSQIDFLVGVFTSLVMKVSEVGKSLGNDGIGPVTVDEDPIGRWCC